MLSMLVEKLAVFAPVEANESRVAKDAALLRPVVRAVCMCILGGSAAADVDDATNETLRRALEHEGKLREGEPVRPWILGIARNVARDVLRARARQHRRTVDEGPESTPRIERIAGSEPSQLDALSDARERARVRKAIEALPEKQREALSAFHLEGKSYQTIAAEMRVPVGTVATWILRGRQTLAERLSG